MGEISGARIARLIRMGAALLLVMALCAPASSFAQGSANRPVRFVVPAAAGGAVDAISRILAQKLTDSWGRQVVVENRAGAGGNIAMELVAKATPDGHTYLTVSQSFAVNFSVYRNPPYHPVKDFAPVMLVATTNGVLLVPPSLAVKSVNELIALARSQPGGLSYVSTGSGTSGHMNMALFINLTGIDIVHVPYKDVTLAQADLMSGRVQMYIAPMPAFVALIKAGRMRALAVTGAKRSNVLPDIPTLQEAGVPGYESMTWYGIYAPARTPRSAIRNTHAELVKVLQGPDVRARFGAMGLDIVASTPEQLAKYLQEEVVKWSGVARKIGLRAE